MIESTVERSLKLKEDLLKIKGVSILEANGHEVDPLKINFAVNGFNGGTVRDFLRDQYQIDPEVFNSQSVLLSCHIGTDEEAYARLPKAIKRLINEGAPSRFAKTLCRPDLPTPDYAMTIDEAFTKKRKTMKLKDAIGMVSGSIYSPCPPGCIVVDIGEEIQEGHLKFFNEDFELEVLEQ